MNEPPIIELENISKSFGSVSALADISIQVNDNEVLGLIGDNGAGKSTLIKIISGVHAPDSGEILVRGKAQKKWDVNIARAHGIETVYQDRALAEQQTITRNIFMGREPLTRWQIGGIGLIVASIGAIVHVINSMVMLINGSVAPITAYPAGLELVERSERIEPTGVDSRERAYTLDLVDGRVGQERLSGQHTRGLPRDHHPQQQVTTGHGGPGDLPFDVTRVQDRAAHLVDHDRRRRRQARHAVIGKNFRISFEYIVAPQFARHVFERDFGNARRRREFFHRRSG